MTIVNGTSSSSYYYIRLNYTLSSTAETTSCAITLQLYWKKHHSHNLSKERPVYINGTGQSQVDFYPTGSYEKNAGAVVNLGSHTYSWSRGTTAATKTISGYAKRSNGSTSSVSTTITVPARTSYTVSYDANTPPLAIGSVTDVPANQSKFYNISLTLSSTTPILDCYSFTGWNTEPDGSGTAYSAGGTYTGNDALTLYAQWEKTAIQTIKTKVEGEWKNAYAFVRINGEWLQPSIGYIKTNGVWEEIP